MRLDPGLLGIRAGCAFLHESQCDQHPITSAWPDGALSVTMSSNGCQCARFNVHIQFATIMSGHKINIRSAGMVQRDNRQVSTM